MIYKEIDDLIKYNKNETAKFEARLNELVIKYDKLVKSLSEGSNDLLKKWYRLCNENYAIQRRYITDYLNGDSIDERDLEVLQYRRQMGARVMPLLLNFINAFEYILLQLPKTNLQLKTAISESTTDLKDYIKSNCPKDSDKNTGFRQELLSMLGFRAQSVANLRKALSENGILNSNDRIFLEGIWDMRNSMHTNFIAQKDIKIDFLDMKSKELLQYSVRKGKALYTPEWGVDVFTERLSMIMVEMINKAEKLEESA